MELRQYYAVVRKYWWLLLLTTALAGGAAYYYSASSPPVYRATSTLEIDQASDPTDDLYRALETEGLLARTYVERIKAPPVLQEAQARLGLALGIDAMIGVAQVGDSQLMRVSAEGNDPALAQALANTVTEVFIEQETQRQQGRFQAGLDELEEQIAALKATIAEIQIEIASLGDPENLPSEFARRDLTRLESELTYSQTRLVVLLTSAEEFRLAMARYTDNITITFPAGLPGAPIGPRTRQNTLLGVVVGLMIGAGVAFTLGYLDDTIKTPDDVKQHLPVGVLGALPVLKGNHGRLRLIVAEEPRQPVSEAFRNLRTSLEFFGADGPPRSILVTSPQPSDGKTFIAANLAAVLAQGGRSVILVDADLRHPRQHRLFDVPREPGLTDVLLAGDQRDAALQPTTVENLRILTGGRHTNTPAEMLASGRMRALLEWLQDAADVVIFDSPPLLAVTDAAVLSGRTAGAILVLDCGETRLPAAAQAVERLQGVEAQVLGVVLNRLSPSADGYYYYYAYYHEDGGRGDGGDGRGGLPARFARLLRPRRRQRRTRRRERSGTDE